MFCILLLLFITDVDEDDSVAESIRTSSMAQSGAASKHSSTSSSPAKMWGGKTGTPSQALCWGGQGFRGFTKVSSNAQGKKKKAHEATQKSKVAAGKEVDTVVNMSLELTGMFVSFVCDTSVCNIFTDMYHT